MARLEKPVLGRLKGKAGNIVGRFFGPEHFISLRPKKYKVKKKIRNVGTKQRFYTAVQLARTIVKYSDLKEVWNKCNMPGKRGYNKLIAANYKLLRDNLPTTENIITPKGRALIFKILKLDNSKMEYSFDMAGLIKPPFKLTLIFIFFNPIRRDCGLTFTNGIQSEIKYDGEGKDKMKSEKYTGICSLATLRNSDWKKFSNVILYAAVAGTSTIKNKQGWTSTVATDITDFK
ncbi:MAG: hypothetical protein P4L27_04040 [Ignavibacteriaceae bacterium]|nr:hypothetical protein [Ignavibacteriaceae bacterium]